MDEIYVIVLIDSALYSAPNIFEFDDVKRGVLCQLFGGVHKQFVDSARGRCRSVQLVVICLYISELFISRVTFIYLFVVVRSTCSCAAILEQASLSYCNMLSTSHIVVCTPQGGDRHPSVSLPMSQRCCVWVCICACLYVCMYLFSFIINVKEGQRVYFWFSISWNIPHPLFNLCMLLGSRYQASGAGKWRPGAV